ncbi:MAG TPA: radical SAM protein [Lachnospiraceae bacterium]|nr:radical SAM protein [Lachnospiraceae bacterium]
MPRHIISKVIPGSIADELGAEPGDELLSINGQTIEDVLDYHFLTNEEYMTVLLAKSDGEEWELEIEKDYEEDLGLVFANGLMDEYRSCRNKCIFCFIDQMPPGMRKTLYFKDDDSRLSFLQGNYVTLTNMDDHDIDRIIHYHMAPINISFHTTNPGLRRRMLNNRFAGDIFDRVRRLSRAGIEMNGQIVLCKGINDGAELRRTLGDLEEYMPALQSVSVVPVGLTKYREGLYPLEAFGPEDAAEVIDEVERWQQYYEERTGSHRIHCGDEWYLLAGRGLPEAERYDGYPQLENGVGMLRLLEEEVHGALRSCEGDGREAHMAIATGLLAAPFLEKLMADIHEIYLHIKVDVVAVKNRFFGEKITVSGLLTGQDLKAQLAELSLGERLLLPCNMLRDGENVFLDDCTVEELEQSLGVPVTVVDADGASLVETIINKKDIQQHRRRQLYEQTDCCYCGTAECGEIHPV